MEENQNNFEEHNETFTGEKRSDTSSELDMTLIVILIGLLGIAIFTMIVLPLRDMQSDDTTKQKPIVYDITNVSEEDYIEDNFQITSRTENYEIPNRDPNVLSLGLSDEYGRMFVVPRTGKTLFVNTDPTCVECVEKFTPYTITTDKTLEHMTMEKLSDGTYHVMWKGQKLYTYNGRVPSTFVFEDELLDSAWAVARP